MENNWLKRNGSTLLTIASGIGFITTLYFAIRNTPKAIERKEEAEKENPDHELTTIEIVKAEIPEYIPTIISGVGTLACMIGSNVLSRKQQANLTTALIALQQTFDTYKDRVDDICGKGTSRFVEKSVEETDDDSVPPWDEKQTFYISEYGKFFDTTLEKVYEAEYHLNRNFALRGYTTINEFFDFLGLEHVENGDDTGWSDYIGETVYGYKWIDFRHRYYRQNDMLICEISFDFAPHDMWEDVT